MGENVADGDEFEGHLDNATSSRQAALVGFDNEALRRAELGYRELLAAEPSDMSARVDLAWCLFIQSLYLSGRECLAMLACSPEEIRSPLANRLPASGQDRSDAVVCGQAVSQAGATGQVLPVLSSAEKEASFSQMFGECVRQMVTVMQLSTRVCDRNAMERLRASIKMAYGVGAVTQANDMGTRILTRLTQELSMRSRS